MKTTLKTGDIVVCIKATILDGNSKGPSLEEGKEYEVKAVLTVGEHDHIDVGLPSTVEYVTCYESKVDLPDGSKVHWCYPARFEKV